MKQHRFNFGRFSSIPWTKLWDWLTGNRLRILLYHSIANNSKDPHATPPQIFHQQVKKIRLDGYQVVSLQEGLELMKNGTSLRKIVVITFDDGYRDFYRVALPILEEFHYSATVFIPTALVGKNAVWDSYDQSKQLMTWEEIVDSTTRGITVGSHTASHRRLTECENGELEYELCSSMEALQQYLGDALPILAYPGGYCTEREKHAAVKAGYKYAVGGVSRWGNGQDTDRFYLRRDRWD
jgi:peptidoglycan/xylan/chitin deacetylase (PgdA/CDA1 family)